MPSSHTEYSPIPTSDNNGAEAGPSRTPPATCAIVSSPLQSSPLQSAPLSFRDEPYTVELSEKASDRDAFLPIHHHTDGPRRKQAGLTGLVEFVKRGKTVILLSICLLLAMMLLLQDKPAPADTCTPNNTGSPGSSNLIRPNSPKKGYRLEDDLVLITKVGSATLHSRLLTHLAEQRVCSLYIPNHLYSSDYPLTLASHNITFFDALSNLSSTITSTQEFSQLHSELTALISSNQDLRAMSDKDGGWKLDKYKFLPTFAQAWRMWPGKKWYVMVEADTFLFYNELVKWLAGLDERKQLMIGHPSWCDYDGKSTVFTHGGSGIVLSKAIMQASFGSDEDFEHHQDELILKSAFGDALLSKSLYDAPKVTLTELSPEGGQRFNSDPPRILKFDRRNWCEPILTLHHVTPADTAHLYDFQRRIEPRLQKGDTIRWGDIWDEFQPEFLRKAMQDVARWDQDNKLSEGEPEVGEVAVKGWQAIENWDSETWDEVTSSANECQKLCRMNQDCLLWQWSKGQGQRPNGKSGQTWTGDRRSDGGDWGKCRYTSDFLRIGIAKPKETHLLTGWMATRIDRWRRDLECSGRTGLNTY
ncbi:hypothetical protein NDA11_002679 [Ustilago hordei]|nr:hypothetical protein NDA11_002679 [Ustilago hordei]